MNDRRAPPPPPLPVLMPKRHVRNVDASVRPGFTHQLSELTTQLSETIGLAEARAKDEGRLRSELKRLQITAARWVVCDCGDFLVVSPSPQQTSLNNYQVPCTTLDGSVGLLL